jgi:hypothetical protein
LVSFCRPYAIVTLVVDHRRKLVQDRKEIEIMRHIGYLHGVTGQPPQYPTRCQHDEYRYYYDQGRRILRAYSSSGTIDEEPPELVELEQPERIAA